MHARINNEATNTVEILFEVVELVETRGVPGCGPPPDGVELEPGAGATPLVELDGVVPLVPVKAGGGTIALPVNAGGGGAAIPVKAGGGGAAKLVNAGGGGAAIPPGIVDCIYKI